MKISKILYNTEVGFGSRDVSLVYFKHLSKTWIIRSIILIQNIIVYLSMYPNSEHLTDRPYN